jgi:hypothetical protein
MSYLISFLRCFFFLSFGFQPIPAGGSLGRDRATSPINVFDSGASSPFRPSCQCTEYSSRISDLESRLSLAKRQAQMAMDKASKSCGFMKQISLLEDKVSGLTARVVHLEECESFLVGIVESACELLRCKVPCDLPLFPFLLRYYWPITSYCCRHLFRLHW